MGTKFQLLRGSDSNFTSITLLAGEPAFTLDGHKFYIGTGSEKVLINNGLAESLETARAIAITGDGTGTANFDGTHDIAINMSLVDTGVTAGEYTKLTVDSKGRVISATNLLTSDLPAITLANITDAGTAAALDVGTGSGEIPVLGSDGKLSVAILPAVAITETFVVTSNAEMLALTAQIGDVAVMNDPDNYGSFILMAEPASTLSNWQKLLTPTSPVTSVAGRIGDIILTKADVGLDDVDNTSDLNKPISTATQTALDDKMNLVTGAIEDNIAVYDDAGQVKDSGTSIVDILDELEDITDALAVDFVQRDISIDFSETNLNVTAITTYDKITNGPTITAQAKDMVIVTADATATPAYTLTVFNQNRFTKAIRDTPTDTWSTYNLLMVNDTLTSTDTFAPLSANQGKILQDTKIGINDIIDGGTF